MACLEGVPLFEDRIDKERVSLSVRSPKFATLSGLQQANIQLLGNPSEKLPTAQISELTTQAVDFWTRLTDLVKPWRSILDGDVKAQDARQIYVSSYALSLWALGFAGNAARAAHAHANGHRTDALEGLADVDWRKTNPTGKASAWQTKKSSPARPQGGRPPHTSCGNSASKLNAHPQSSPTGSSSAPSLNLPIGVPFERTVVRC